jgi:hypothetical protein
MIGFLIVIVILLYLGLLPLLLELKTLKPAEPGQHSFFGWMVLLLVALFIPIHLGAADTLPREPRK